MKSFNDPVLNEHVESITFSEFSNEDEVKVTNIGFDLTVVVMKKSIFWDITQCGPLKVNQTFRRNMSPPSSGSKNKPSKKPA
jgi:hypothetical protein